MKRTRFYEKLQFCFKKKMNDFLFAYFQVAKMRSFQYITNKKMKIYEHYIPHKNYSKCRP